MKSFLGSLLLILGTVVASLAAATSERPWRAVALDDVALDDPGTVLFEDVYLPGDDPSAAAPTEEPDGAESTAPAESAAPQSETAEPSGEDPPLVAEVGEPVPVGRAGDPVTVSVTAALREAGTSTVRVRKRARTEESVPVSGTLEGRMLAEDLFEDAASGRLLTQAEVERRIAIEEAARAILSDEVTSAALAQDAEGAWVQAGALSEVSVSALDLEAVDVDARLRGIPPMRRHTRAPRYIDGALAELLSQSDLEAVDLAIPSPPFDLVSWPGAIPFGAGVVAMVFGVVLMRSGRREQLVADGARPSDEPRPIERLALIVAAVRALRDEARALDPDAFLERAEAVLSEDCVAFVEERDALRLALGGKAYAAVMASFSTGERRLSRAWSAAADGYRQEAVTSLGECVEPFEDALAALEEGHGEGGGESEPYRSATSPPESAGEHEERETHHE